VSDPDRLVASRDGTPIAVFESGQADRGARPLVLVHGTASDHLTFRVVGPILARRRRLFAVDRRGRGASGDGPAYAISREFEDVVAVCDEIAAETGDEVDVLGHSFGGRCALGASLATTAIGRIVSCEGAPPRGSGAGAGAEARAGAGAEPVRLLEQLRTDLALGDLEGLLERFMRAVAGMDDGGIARFRADPVWPLRVASSPTIVRELEASGDADAGLEALAAVRVPVLQLIGSASPPAFRARSLALAARLPYGQIVEIDGAAHAPHHTHPGAFVAAVEAFLDG
jgi:pimeloyl-ACP methyl ester carboxylesterase